VPSSGRRDLFWSWSYPQKPVMPAIFGRPIASRTLRASCLSATKVVGDDDCSGAPGRLLEFWRKPLLRHNGRQSRRFARTSADESVSVVDAVREWAKNSSPGRIAREFNRDAGHPGPMGSSPRSRTGIQKRQPPVQSSTA